MFKAFFAYFFKYLIKARSRQKLLFFAFIGLGLSSFSLLVLQSTMGGLQKSVIERSQDIFGSGEVLFHPPLSYSKAEKISRKLSDDGFFNHQLEYRLEALVRREQFLSPAIIFGIDKNNPPSFLKGQYFNEAILGADLFNRLGALRGDAIQIISPAHTNPFFRDVPRTQTIYVDASLRTFVEESDQLMMWVDQNKIFNLIRGGQVNRIRFEGPFDFNGISNSLEAALKNQAYQVHTWEMAHQTLAWALSLETSVMVFLFFVMTLLVSLCIVSGLLLFFDKIELDLSSFWILGASKRNLNRSVSLFFLLLVSLSITMGILLGLALLFALEKSGIPLLPAIFVDREIPIHITLQGLLIASFVPLGIGSLFLSFVLVHFTRRVDYLERIRVIG